MELELEYGCRKNQKVGYYARNKPYTHGPKTGDPSL